MNILLLEDDDYKCRDVSSFLEELRHKCITCNSINMMKENVAQKRFDVVIIDLYVPRRNEKEFADYGYEAIAYLRTTTDTIFYPKRIIVLSRFLDEKTIMKLNDMGTISIKYEENEKQWKEKLRDELEYVSYLAVKKADIAIITAVENEKKQINKVFDWQRMEIPDESLQFYSCEVKGSTGKPLMLVHCHVSRKGMVASAYATAKTFQLFEPDCIIMVGIAGGRKGKVNEGDIVLAETAVDYSSGSMEEDENGKRIFKPNSDEISMSPIWVKCFKDYEEDKALLRKIKDLSDITEDFSNEVKLHIGKMATGPAVIKSEQFCKEYIGKFYREYLAVDMETYAVYYVARNYPCTYMSIKGISDVSDKDKGDLFQKYAALLAANLTKYYILNNYKKAY